MNTPSQSGRTSGGQPSWEPPSPEALAASLPAYEVIEILGRGGMGAVYKARQKSLKRWVAIKVLPLVAADDELQFAERFRNEAETMARMSHPAIVNVHDFGETSDGLLYIVMEFIDGTDVHRLIQGSGRLSEDYALAITAHVCDALAYAHARGVIHRDIKPANILIDQEGNVKVADFGLAKMTHPDLDYGLTRSNVAMGTPDYVAPEVLSYGLVADHRADLYAVGVMLYQMLTGEVPRGLFKLPSQKDIDADPRFDDIICKAMEPDRDERYQSAMDVRAALDVILTTALPKEEEAAAVAMATQRPVKKSSSRGLWIGVGGLVAVLGVAAFFVFGGIGKMKGGAAIGTSDVSPAVEGKPVDAAFLAEVAAAPAEQQVELVVKKIEALNGGSLLPPKVTVTKGVATGIELSRDGGSSQDFRDLSPIAALRGLTNLRMNGFNPDDLSFLRGLKIEKLQIYGGTFAVDFVRDLPLTEVTLRGVATDFSALKDKPLKSLDLSSSRVRDIAFVKGMPLNVLLVDRTGVTDLSPIRELPLRKIVCDFVPERDTEILRSIPTLEFINEKPVAEFWASVGAQHTPNSVTQGNTIDLLALVDVKRDAVAGEWTRTADGLSVAHLDGATVLQLPYRVPEEYDYEIEFTANDTGLNVNQYLSAGGNSFAWKLNAHARTPPLYGFELLDGKFCKDFDQAAAKTDFAIEPGRRHRSLIEVRRGKLRALVDGREIVKWTGDLGRFSMEPITTLRDQDHLGIGSYKRAVTFHKITVREITGTETVEASASSPPTPPDPWIDRLGTMKWETPWSLKKGALSTSAPTTMQELGQVGDGALRIRARLAAGTDKGQLKGPRLQPALRIGPVKGATDRQGSYQFQAYSPGGACSLVYLERDLKTGTDLPPEYLWKNSALPPDLRGKEEIEWEFRAVGDELSAWADGQFVASARDARVSAGRSKLTAFPGIEITSVETSGIKANTPAAANQNGPPNITNWQDMTEAVCNEARSIPILTVENGQVSRGDQGATPRIQLSRDGIRNYAVRGRFTGQIQVNLRRNDQGFIYVLCQSVQTIFQRYDQRLDAPAVLSPGVLHPPGYDSTQPHEILVTMQGSTIRTWLDGRFVGEAYDDTFAGGTADVAFMKRSSVQKVEIAELEPSPSVTSADWQPLFTKPEDFGTDAANVEIRDGWLFANTAKTHYAPTDSIDGAIRATLRFYPQHTADLTARANDGAPWGKEAYACSVFITPDGKTATIMNTMEKIDGEKPWKRHDFPLPAALREGEEFALELRVEGDQIAVLFNGKKLGSVTHPFPATNRHFGIMTSMTGVSEFRDVAWQKLE